MVSERVDADSRARTHLANERTFLAWFRTGLTLIALGIASAELLPTDGTRGILVRAIATALAASGIVVSVVGAHRYQTAREQIGRSGFEPASHSIWFTATAAGATGLLAIAFVWVLGRG